MAEQKFCKDCNQKDNCQNAYQQLGNIKCPSVVSKVILAFLLPVVIFVVSLAVFEKIFTEVIDTEELRTFLSFLLAMLMAFIFVVSCSLLVARRNNK